MAPDALAASAAPVIGRSVVDRLFKLSLVVLSPVDSEPIPVEVEVDSD